MITRHHIALTILCTLILCSALVPASPVLIFVICTGACIGAILPDVQMKRPKGIQVRVFAWIVTLFGSFICTPLLCSFYRHLTGRTFDTRDKWLTHSVPGIVLLWAVLAGFLLVPASIFLQGTALGISIMFLSGVMLGMVLHLVEDLCTRKGITPFFPFSTMKVSGSIRPCDANDRRIAQFHYYYGSVAGIVLAFQYLATGYTHSTTFICLFGLASCMGMMIWSSEVEIIPEDPKDARPTVPPVVLLDPVSFPGAPRYPTSGLMMGVYYFG
ncbi:MAG: metal-dependent hydrolase [Methanoregula sp.]|nr:metal-dependent hydrolase [Methanoregula sp.]